MSVFCGGADPPPPEPAHGCYPMLFRPAAPFCFLPLSRSALPSDFLPRPPATSCFRAIFLPLAAASSPPSSSPFAAALSLSRRAAAFSALFFGPADSGGFGDSRSPPSSAADRLACDDGVAAPCSAAFFALFFAVPGVRSRCSASATRPGVAAAPPSRFFFFALAPFASGVAPPSAPPSAAGVRSRGRFLALPADALRGV